MAVIDLGKRQITLTVAYFGPRQAGCGTNVRQLHRAQPPQRRVDLLHTGAHHGGDERQDRIWHFTTGVDELAQLGGCDVLVQVVSLPSTSDVLMDREPFLDRVDGVVFVADARAQRHEDNVAALLDLQACLVRRGLDLAAIPLVFQVNQTDHTSARPAARVLEELDAAHGPAVEAAARHGRGVLEAWDAIRRLVLGRLMENAADGALALTVTALSRAAREGDLGVVLDHAAGLPQATKAAPDVVTSASATEVVLAPDDLVATQPLHVLSCELRAGRARVELLVRRADGTTRRLAFVLEPRAEGAPPPPEEITQPIHPSGLGALSSGMNGVTETHETERDLPGLVYGLIGVGAGFLAGFLVRFIFFG